jgi:hypothetical protein
MQRNVDRYMKYAMPPEHECLSFCSVLRPALRFMSQHVTSGDPLAAQPAICVLQMTLIMAYMAIFICRRIIKFIDQLSSRDGITLINYAYHININNKYLIF